MIKTEPTSATDWRAVQSALLVDVEGWNALADAVIIQPGLPKLIAEDYAIGIGRAYRQMAQVAKDAADRAGRYADEAAHNVAAAACARRSA